MSGYNFKRIRVVPTSTSFVDIILSKTQRKTPTVIHKGYAIGRIRGFYLRKVKYTQQNFHEKLTAILEDFPRLDDIHPFYADLINVLYDRDHYKLALGQLNTARSLIDNLGKDYARLLKFGDSLYRCKQLKRAALGRMATIMKKQGPSLGYLEQVRQHLSRLPSIDPNERTIIIAGYPNVGKSSFMNCLTRANVDVQPYPFTTKSLFVGHMDYQFVRWQLIDTPGILDRPLEERNTIEMQSITAMAHLRSAVLYFLDISESCGYSIQAQVELFNSIKPLFTNKPLMVVLSKMDVMRPEQLDDDSRALIESLTEDPAVELGTVSSFSQEGVTDVKKRICDKLMSLRVDIKVRSGLFTAANRLNIAQPSVRDSKARPAVEPDRSGVKSMDGASPAPRVVTKGPNFNPRNFRTFDPDRREDYDLADSDWRFDTMPEILDGKNVLDYVDPDISDMLDALEREEEVLERKAAQEEDVYGLAISDEDAAAIRAYQRDRDYAMNVHAAKRTLSKPQLPKRNETVATTSDFAAHLQQLGLKPDAAVARVRSRSALRSQERDRGRQRVREVARERGQKRRPSASPGDALSDANRAKTARMARTQQRQRNLEGRAGDGDRRIPTKMPRWLFSGKRGIGKTDRR